MQNTNNNLYRHYIALDWSQKIVAMATMKDNGGKIEVQMVQGETIIRYTKSFARNKQHHKQRYFKYSFHFLSKNFSANLIIKNRPRKNKPIKNVNIKVFRLEKEPIKLKQWAENLKNGTPFKRLMLSVDTDNNGNVTAELPEGVYEAKVEEYGLSEAKSVSVPACHPVASNCSRVTLAL